MKGLDEDTVALLSKRAYDIAGSMANRPGKKLAVTAFVFSFLDSGIS